MSERTWPRTITPYQRDLIVDRLLGTSDGEYDVLIELPGGDALDEGDVIEALADANVGRCEECDVWCEMGELTDDDGDTVSCASCGGHKIAG